MAGNHGSYETPWADQWDDSENPYYYLSDNTKSSGSGVGKVEEKHEKKVGKETKSDKGAWAKVAVGFMMPWQFLLLKPLQKNKKNRDNTKAVALTGMKKAKEGTIVGFHWIKNNEKTKAVASTGMKKMKEGSVVGFHWIKDKYKNTNDKQN